ncbi:MAG: crossover junction endodeoxyribonuclease RuvC [Bacteroidetes bacterium HGW-Bacteroidetes-10]|nr:MAG: crossover junction endodeoxyribonuclease RuvC [Bacteroidetes bacterium HGW-Bacteroidetes-10]
MAQNRVILGIDPGSQIMGYGVIEVVPKSPKFITMGVVDLRKEKDHFLRIRQIFIEVTGLIEHYRPDELAIEAPFYGKNIQSMLKLGRAQGSAIAAALNRNMPIFEYAPRKVKLAITGKGAASKEQVAALLMNILNTGIKPEFYDASDGLAVALCHYYQTSGPVVAKSSSKSWESFVKSNPERIK